MPDESRPHEASCIYRALFGCPAPEDVQQQYAAALDNATLAAWPSLNVARLAARGVDLEAMELALRRRQPRNALSQRFQVISYLAEIRPERYPTYINDSRRTVRGYAILVFHAGRSVYKLLKGRRLLKIHDVG